LEKNYAAAVRQLVKTPINQNQFDALSSFVYNVGVEAFSDSTMLKKININHNDPTIRDEFMKFVYGGGRYLEGLANRRVGEADLYFS
jgi:lysozyme